MKVVCFHWFKVRVASTNFRITQNIGMGFKSRLLQKLAASQEAERQLKNLVRHGLMHLDRGVIQELLKDYPFEGGTLYRGVNFRTEEDYKKFMAETRNGTVYQTGRCTSWTTHEGTAEQFATTWPVFNLNRELAQAEDERRNNKEWMLGHRGIILKFECPRNTAIDVSETEHAAEDEVLLLPGTYNIEVIVRAGAFLSIDNQRHI
jgi:hypothetical protein